MSTNNTHNVSEKELDNLLGQAFLNLDFNNPKNEELMETISNHTMNMEPMNTGFFNRSIFTKLITACIIIATSIAIYFMYPRATKQNAELKPALITNNVTPRTFAEEKTNATESVNIKEEKPIAKNNILPQIPEHATQNPLVYVEPKINEQMTEHVDNVNQIKQEDSSYVFPKLTEKEIKATKRQKLAMSMWLVKPKGKYNAITSERSSYLSASIKDTGTAFYMQNYEVTNLEYRTFLFDLLIQDRKKEFLIAKPHQNLWLQVSQLKHPERMKDHYFSDHRFNNFPVLNITPEGAELYCKWLEETAKMQGVDLNARLPYENEWKRAARAGSGKGSYTWGTDSMQNKRGCYLANFCIKKQSEKLNPRVYCDPKKYPNAYTSAGLMLGDSVLPVLVDSYNPNDFGLYCMMGNAAEMVYDNKTKTVKTKGGSWNTDLDGCKINSEEELNGSIRANPMTGFRPIFKLLPKDNFGAMDRDDPKTGLSILNNEEKAGVLKEKTKMINQLVKLSKDKYAYIPMGSCEYKKNTISVQAFYIETTEVTNLEYRTFLADLLIQKREADYVAAKPQQKAWITRFPYSYNEPMANMYFWHPAYNEYPVVNISIKGAQLYCDWLTIETNKVLKETNKPLINDLRIPDEYEWAYAASNKKNQVKYANGNAFLRNSKGNYEVNYMCYSKEECRYDSLLKLYVPKVYKQKYIDDGAFHTALTKSYAPNSYGLYCMAGNVAEMVVAHSNNKPETKGGGWFSVDNALEIDADNEFNNEIDNSPLIGFRPVFTAFKK